MSLIKPQTPAEDITFVEGVLASAPEIGRMAGGAAFASCTLRASGPVGEGQDAHNATWNVIVHRQPAVEQLKAAIPGDVLEIHGVADAGRILVPRTAGRIDILLSD